MNITTADIAASFADFSKELNNDIAIHAAKASFTAGDILIKSGQYMTHTIMLTKGKIKIYREDDEGREFFMYYLLPGQACAISLICATKMETSQIMAKAVEDGEIYKVPIKQMNQWMMQHRSWYEFVVSTYRSRFEELLLVLDHVAFRGMDERLEFYLKRHVEVNGGLRDLQLTHQEIANELSSSREVISRLLKKMEQRGWIKLHRNHIEIVNL